MINLIPPKGHKTLKREYFLRVGAVYCFLLAGVFFVFTVLLIPTYVLVSTQMKTLSLGNSGSVGLEDDFKNAEDTVREANQIITQLKAAPPGPTISEVIQEIKQVAGNEITFRTFGIERANGAVSAVEVQGIARTRNSLAALENSLESSPLFETADVPISDLARDVDLPFHITITLKKAQP